MFTAQYAVICTHNAFDSCTPTLQEINSNFAQWIVGLICVISDFNCKLDQLKWCANWCLTAWRSGLDIRSHQLKDCAVLPVLEAVKTVVQEEHKHLTQFIKF